MKRQAPTKWTEEEHQILVQGFEKYGPKPKAILRAYPSLMRSASLIKNKLKMMVRLHKQKRLINNFSDELKRSSKVATNNITAAPLNAQPADKDTQKHSDSDLPKTKPSIDPSKNLWNSGIDRFLFVPKMPETVVKIE